MTARLDRPSRDDSTQTDRLGPAASRAGTRAVAADRRSAAKSLDAPFVVVVVPTFHPPEDLPARLALLRREVAHVVIVDDGTGPSADAVLGAIEQDGLQVVRLAENSGIAAALNTGVAVARERAATHILTLDQDSTVEQGYVPAALVALRELLDLRAGVLAVAAGTVDGTTLETSRRTGRFFRVHETLQSGLIFSANALQVAGHFDESLFIDCVDSDIILRGAALGLGTFFVPECRLSHRLGEAGAVTLPGGRRLEFAYHGPVRRYYITRNRAVLEARFGRRFPRWAAVQLIDQTRYFSYCLLFGEGRAQQALAAAAGLVHAATGRRGRIPPRLASMLQRR